MLQKINIKTYSEIKDFFVAQLINQFTGIHNKGMSPKNKSYVRVHLINIFRYGRL